jgi:hypothetical protein
VNSDFLARRYWRALTGTRSPEGLSYRRGRDGYSLWRRYWASLLDVWLPPASAPVPALATLAGRLGDDGVVASARRNPLTGPHVDGQGIRLPRFDRAALRLAASSEAGRMSAIWTVGGRTFVLRESGPDQVDVLVEADRSVPAMQVLPIRIASPVGDREYLMVFTGEPSGRSVGVLRLPDVLGWIDLMVGVERSVTGLDTADPAVRAAIAGSVRATPDPGMSAWADIVVSRPPDDPLRQVIEDAAR